DPCQAAVDHSSSAPGRMLSASSPNSFGNWSEVATLPPRSAPAVAPVAGRVSGAVARGAIDLAPAARAGHLAVVAGRLWTHHPAPSARGALHPAAPARVALFVSRRRVIAFADPDLPGAAAVGALDLPRAVALGAGHVAVAVAPPAGQASRATAVGAVFPS